MPPERRHTGIVVKPAPRLSTMASKRAGMSRLGILFRIDGVLLLEFVGEGEQYSEVPFEDVQLVEVPKLVEIERR